MSALAYRYHEESAAVDAAAAHAVDLIRTYSNDHNPEAVDSPWRNPEGIYERLDRARTKISDAWNRLQQAMDKDQDDDKTTAAVADNSEDDMRAAYVDMITDAFADVLEDLRSSSNSNDGSSAAEVVDVNILVDCLQSGLDFLSADERELFMQDHYETYHQRGKPKDDDDYNNDDEEEEEAEEEGSLTPHEIRRRELGFHVVAE